MGNITNEQLMKLDIYYIILILININGHEIKYKEKFFNKFIDIAKENTDLLRIDMFYDNYLIILRTIYDLCNSEIFIQVIKKI